jgi:hypothetical protein
MDDLFNQYGFVIVFGAVLLEQLGIPLPALPILIAAGALAANGRFSPAAIFFTALSALAFVATKLIDRGFTNVRPLHGGLDAWIAAGHAVEVRAPRLDAGCRIR